MTIDRAYLEGHIAHLRKQIAGYAGALEFAEMLLGQLPPQEQEADGMPVAQFAEMIGGAGARAEISENGEA